MRINLENVIFILKITPLSLYMMGLQ
jgi:hypothetical protein